ncbi:methylated-DNA--[protein]-cysteine S-methyltransferase [Cupriavidus basilensis]|uniref:Methylated-DNA--protein-cysteine methyltransferase n=1 Tax=Cupriavidus basilensis TaxID=68895 RepID=A0ABT6AYE9_9BURK|nr:methylated-DNA--[protein]-cysteine S-methyltransferase [Cupriavidus basilensis]MDF3837647.1 methylated-DNA--[protein]-cysteine S-methyltransferase [Cupriavidus basilensis]
MIAYRIVASPLGEVLLRADGARLSGLFFAGQKYYPAAATADAAVPAAAKPILEQAADELADYFAERLQAFTVPMLLAGSPFQRTVWQALCAIPFGETTSYGELAAGLGLAPTHARAVGGAVGRNPLSVIVPCHRVLGASGDLTGYAGGTDRKRALLRLEGTAAAMALPILRQSALAFE